MRESWLTDTYAVVGHTAATAAFTALRHGTTGSLAPLLAQNEPKKLCVYG